jgi:hypothetical protein
VSDIRPGEVKIDLGDEVVTLRPTARAVRRLGERFDGIMGIAEALARLRLDAFVEVIAAGAAGSGGPSGSTLTKEQRAELEDAVFRAGLANLVQPLSRYVGILANGGRPPKDEEAQEASDPNG